MTARVCRNLRETVLRVVRRRGAPGASGWIAAFGPAHVPAVAAVVVTTGVTAMLAMLATGTAVAAFGSALDTAVDARDAKAPPRLRPLPLLQPGVRRQRTMAPAQTHVYGVQLDAGDFLRVIIAPRGIDVAATLRGPDDRDLLTADLTPDPDLPETMLIIAPSAGRYRIAVTASAGKVSAGRYAITLADRRLATAADVTRVAAMRKLEAGMPLRAGNAAARQQAFEQFEAAQAGFHDAGDREGEARAIMQTALVGYDLYRPDALDRSRQALALFRDRDDRVEMAIALGQIALMQMRAGEIHDAIDAATQALAVARAAGSRTHEATTRNVLGMLYGRSGEAERAAIELQQALGLAREMRLTSLELHVLNNLGVSAKNLGDYRQSLAYYRQTLTLARTLKQPDVETSALNNLGNLHRLLGDNAAALEDHQQALALARASGHADQEARALNTLGSTYYQLGDFQRALDHHEQSLALRQQAHDLASEASTLDGAGRALTQLGQRDKAYQYLTEALRLRRAISERYAEADSLLHLARFERDRDNLAVALDDIEASVQLTDALRGRVVSPDLRASFVAAEQERYALYIDLLMQQDARHPGEGFNARALEASERGRARVLLESLIEARTDIRRGIDPALLASEHAAQQQLDDASGRLSRLMARQSEAKDLEAARAAIERDLGDYQQLEARIRQESPAYAALTQPRALSLAEIQREMVDPDTLLLEFALGQTRSWLWVVSPASIESVELPPRPAIEAAARHIYALLTARQPKAGESAATRTTRVASADTRWREASTQFSQMLLGGAAARLGDAWRGKRLLIAADGALEYVPFAALPDPTSGATQNENREPRVIQNHAQNTDSNSNPEQDRRRNPRPPRRQMPSAIASLVQTHEIVNVPSASVLALMRQETARRPRAAKSLAVLADPVFEADDPRVGAPARGSSRDAADRPAQSGRLVNDPAANKLLQASLNDPAAVSLGQRALRSAGDIGETRMSRLVRLPFSRQEALAIAALVPARERLEATDFHATRALATSGELGGYRLVHFATHGVFNSEHPELSGLVLSLVRPNGQAQDGFLRLSDIYNLRLPADVVVLSACQTALGKDIRGEGLVGLTRGFMYAGARRIVASLWQVDDLATAELMRRFYRGMLKDGLRPAAALRAAQQQLSARPQWSSPFFWSAFVIQGEWQ
jgi:CHAT domain-containing protein